LLPDQANRASAPQEVQIATRRQDGALRRRRPYGSSATSIACSSARPTAATLLVPLRDRHRSHQISIGSLGEVAIYEASAWCARVSTPAKQLLAVGLLLLGVVVVLGLQDGAERDAGLEEAATSADRVECAIQLEDIVL
jgi:hypothetical protein